MRKERSDGIANVMSVRLGVRKNRVKFSHFIEDIRKAEVIPRLFHDFHFIRFFFHFIAIHLF